MELRYLVLFVLFFFNDPATTDIYTSLHTLSLHDALPISTRFFRFAMHSTCDKSTSPLSFRSFLFRPDSGNRHEDFQRQGRSEEHTSELQSLMRISYAVFCLKKKTYHNSHKIQLYTMDKN